ncbi:hypothetical protein KAR52_01155 [Candidatus Pacearchaeota archaeon]|nr:hypothetical protein [Candidatus Pacearchaeota archaeon]
MKNIFLVSFVIILLTMTFSVVQADSEGMQVGEGEKVNVQTGNYVGEQGEAIQIQMREQNQFELRVGNTTADCDCELVREQVQNKTRLYAKLSNGEHAEIKVMPDRASENALQKLKLANCGEDCTIELKEVGVGTQAKMAYELTTERSAKVFGLFRARMEVKAQVDAETGEIVRVRKPWWAFLAFEPEE